MRNYVYHPLEIRVIDGDTIEAVLEQGFGTRFEGRFRLFGIDCPERGQPGHDESRDHLQALIDRHSPIEVHTYKDRTGKYGRFLAALVSESGFHLNERMILDGHAVDYQM